MNVGVVSTLGQALADPTRLQVLALCTGKLGVGEIATTLNLSSPSISHHVAVLERAGLVTVERRGRQSVARRVGDGVRMLVRELG